MNSHYIVSCNLIDAKDICSIYELQKDILRSIQNSTPTPEVTYHMFAPIHFTRHFFSRIQKSQYYHIPTLNKGLLQETCHPMQTLAVLSTIIPKATLGPLFIFIIICILSKRNQNVGKEKIVKISIKNCGNLGKREQQLKLSFGTMCKSTKGLIIDVFILFVWASIACTPVCLTLKQTAATKTCPF